MNDKYPYDLVIGLDRADKKADLHFIDVATQKSWNQTLNTAPEQLHDWLAQLRQQYPQACVGLCLEQPAGNLIPFLETYSWITLLPINPITLQKFREAFVTSRAKDDAKDARYLAELVLSHHDKIKPWQPEDTQTRMLQQLIVHRRGVVDERTGMTNRLQALLKQYFPQALDLCGQDLWRPLATDFLLKWPTLQALRKARTDTISQFYYLHGSRSKTLLAKRLDLIQKAVALTDEPALLETFQLRIELTCKELQLVTHAVADYDQRIAKAFAQHPERELFAHLPGGGKVLAPRLLTAFGTQRERFDNCHQLQCYSGIAPVTKQSGSKRHVHRRYLCPIFLKQSFHEFAAQSILECRWAAAYYLQRRNGGAGHHAAVRALAYKWIRILFRCWQTHTPYEDARYETALRRHNSPVVALFDKIILGKSPFKSTSRNKLNNN
jgi:transposase